MEALDAINISSADILFWLVYGYQAQCAMEFHPMELLRLGESGIHLNIDCFEENHEEG